MTLPRVLVALVLTGAGLSGCSPHVQQLRVCSTGPYRYANPNGTSLPALAVPAPYDLKETPPQATQADPAAMRVSPPARTPGAAQPRHRQAHPRPHRRPGSTR